MMKGEEELPEIADSVTRGCDCCDRVREHVVTVALETALTRGNLLEGDDAGQRVRILRCVECGNSTKVNAV